jgi:N-acetylglucosaminyldiphosphoundecaprenol N-acetyl-beta-D-mannosaminyltransferase
MSRLILQACSLEEASTRVSLLAGSDLGSSIRFVNSYSLGLFCISSEYRETLRESELNFPDGKPQVIMARLFHHGHGQNAVQIRGVDLMRQVLMDSTPDEKHLFFGSTFETLESVKVMLETDFPNVQNVKFIDPGNVEDRNRTVEQLVHIVEIEKANFVWISLGTPLQDFISTEASKRSAGVFIGVGAAFGFLAGKDLEASLRIQKFGLEWAHRLWKEPKRLWKRYLLISPIGIILSCTRLITWRRNVR